MPILADRDGLPSAYLLRYELPALFPAGHPDGGEHVRNRNFLSSVGYHKDILFRLVMN